MHTPFGEIPDRWLPRLSMADAHDHVRRQEISRRRFLRGLGAGAAVLAAGPTLWRQPGLASVPPFGAHLAYGDDPTRGMSICWGTEGAVEGAAVEFGTGPVLGRSVDADGASVAGTDTLYHRVRLERLRPDTEYRYRMVHRGAASPTYTFRTAPDRAKAFRFTCFGDQGVDHEATTTTARVAALSPALHFHVGDLCYAYRSGSGSETGVPFLDATDQRKWDQWFVQNEGVAAHIPWMPTVGNHEMEFGYGPQGYDGVDARFVLPRNGVSGAALTYSFRYGNVGFVSLDGNDASYQLPANHGWLGSEQDIWLHDTLQALRGDSTTDFIVVGFHNCSYCSNVLHGSDAGTRDRWDALFDEFDVDVVINGHNHCYERTHPLRQGEVTADAPRDAELDPGAVGTTFITAGGGGGSDYPVFTYPLAFVSPQDGLVFFGPKEVEGAQWSAVRRTGHSVLVGDADPLGDDGQARLRLFAVTPAGEEFDRVTFRRPAKAAGGRNVGLAADHVSVLHA